MLGGFGTSHAVARFPGVCNRLSCGRAGSGIAHQEALCVELGLKRDLGYCYANWGFLARAQKDRQTEHELQLWIIHCSRISSATIGPLHLASLSSCLSCVCRAVIPASAARVYLVAGPSLPWRWSAPVPAVPLVGAAIQSLHLCPGIHPPVF